MKLFIFTKIQKNTVHDPVELAYSFIQEGKLDEAEKTLRAISNTRRADPDFWFASAVLGAKKGKSNSYILGLLSNCMRNDVYCTYQISYMGLVMAMSGEVERGIFYADRARQNLKTTSPREELFYVYVNLAKTLSFSTSPADLRHSLSIYALLMQIFPAQYDLLKKNVHKLVVEKGVVQIIP